MTFIMCGDRLIPLAQVLIIDDMKDPKTGDRTFTITFSVAHNTVGNTVMTITDPKVVAEFATWLDNQEIVRVSSYS